MNELRLEPSASTPRVELDATSGSMLLAGACYPENAVSFFGDIFAWVTEYTTSVHGRLSVTMNLSYFNSSSSKCLLDLIELLEEYAGVGGRVDLVWHYEEDDEDMMESGEELADGVSFPFKLVMDKVEE